MCCGVQTFDWLQPVAAGPGSSVQTPDPIAAHKAAAQAAAAPRSLQDEQNVRSFISQAGTSKPIMGRRLAEVSTPSSLEWCYSYNCACLGLRHQSCT